MVADPDVHEKQEHMADVLDQVRFRSAVAVAWIRVLACSISVLVWMAAWTGGQAVAQAAGPTTIIRATHLAMGIGLLWFLLRRPSRSLVLAGAVLDLALVSVAAVVGFPSGGQPLQNVLQYTALLQLLLLVDALTVDQCELGTLAAGSWALVAVLAAHRRLPFVDAVLDLVVLGVFGATIALAGSRYLELAARVAAQEWTARVAERHARELQAMNTALRTAQAEARELSSLIVHDLRNPLASIWANLEEVRETLSPSHPSGHEAIDVAIGELRRLNDLIGDLLVVMRLENESRHDTDLVWIDPLLSDLKHALGPLVRKAGARLELRRDSDASPRMRANPALVRRMLDNLVANAARYVRPGDRVEVAAEADGERLRLAVRNSGPPVSADVRDRLFEKHATTGMLNGHNVGLGLYMCRLVAERHGGSIALVDRQGWTVSFEVTLPAG